MRVDEAKLRVYRDGELSELERKSVEEYLAGSVEAQVVLARLNQNAELVTQALHTLSQAAGNPFSARQGFKQLQGRLAPPDQAQPATRQVPISFLAAWESPSLLNEFKAVLISFQTKGRLSMLQSIRPWRISLAVTLGLLVTLVAVTFALTAGSGQRLAEQGQQFLKNIITSQYQENTPGQEAGAALAPVTSEVITTTVIVALRPISQGTTIQPEAIGRRDWPANNLPPGHITGEAEAIGKMARMDIVQGQVVVREMLASPAAELRFELKDVRQLTPCENKGRSQLLIRVQDSQGLGLDFVPVKIQWQAGPDEFAILKTQTLHDEPGWIEFTMAQDKAYTLQVVAAASQVATDLTSRFGQDEPCQGQPGNGPGRVSFEVIFQQAEFSPVAAGEAAWRYGIQADPHGDTGANIQHLQALGFGWVKFRMPWKEVEPIQGSYSWEPWDEVIKTYAAQNVRVLLNIVHAPDWARPADDDRSVEGLPADPAAYAAFVAQVADRYRGQVQAIEVWNEQNVWYKVGGRGRIDAADYVKLLQQTYPVVKAANAEMLVISGGMSPAGNVGDMATDDIEYLDMMYTAGAKGYFDALSAHPLGYNCPALADWRTVTPEEASADSGHGLFTARHHSWCFLGTVEGYREIMIAHDDGRTPIWITEFGWATAEQPAQGFEYAGDNTPEEQAQWIVEAYQWGAEQDWIGPMFLWNLDYNFTAPDTPLGYFSILNRPAYKALVEMEK